MVASESVIAPGTKRIPFLHGFLGWVGGQNGAKTKIPRIPGQGVEEVQVVEYVAEGVGFEPTVTSLPHSISSRAP